MTTTCPNCGQPVREGQRFCGACGTDVPAALNAAAASRSSGESTSYGGESSSPDAYSQPPDYGYVTPPSNDPPAGRRLLIIAGALILAICCAFACGLLFGFELIPDLLGIGGAAGPAPRPTTVPTPSTWLPVLHYLLG